MTTNNPMSTIPPLGQPMEAVAGVASSKFKPVDPIRQHGQIQLGPRTRHVLADDLS